MTAEQGGKDADLARLLQELDAADGDLERVIREHPEAVDLRPYLELATSLTGLRQDAPPSDNEALRQDLVNQAMQWCDRGESRETPPEVADQAPD